MQKEKSFDLQKTCPATWYEHTPEGVYEASATAYFFARKLYEVLEVPVGIINVSWGGTPIEAWMNPEVLRKEFAGEIKLDHLDTRVCIHLKRFFVDRNTNVVVYSYDNLLGEITHVFRTPIPYYGNNGFAARFCLILFFQLG